MVEHNMEKGMVNYNQTGYDGVTKTWDLIQREVAPDYLMSCLKRLINKNGTLKDSLILYVLGRSLVSFGNFAYCSAL